MGGVQQDDQVGHRAAKRRTRRKRDADGLVVIGADRTVRHVDPLAYELLDGDLALGDRLPRVLLHGGAVTVDRDGDGGGAGPRVELRSRRSTVDGEEGWVLTVADVSARRSPEQRAIELLALAGHELRTPIAAVAGYAGTIRMHGDRLGQERIDEMLGVIERQAGRLGRMATTLLSLAKPAGEDGHAQPEVLRLGQLIAETVELFGEQADAVSVSGTTDLLVVADSAHLQEMITNLVSNAFKYGRPPVELTVALVDGRAEIAVTDHGDGVPPGFVERMWEPFARARAEERPPGVDGAGLGLSLVQTLAALNRGSIRYEADGPGSTFVLSLPSAEVRLT